MQTIPQNSGAAKIISDQLFSRGRPGSRRPSRPSPEVILVTTSTFLPVILPCPHGLPPAGADRRSPMLAFVRAVFAAALVVLLSVPAIAADKPFKRDDLADAAIKLEAQIKAEAGPVDQDRRRAAARGRRRLPAQRLPHRHADPRADRRGRARRQRELAAARQVRAADPSEQRPRTHRAARARRDRRLHRLSAQRGNAGEEAESLVVDRAQLCRPLALASGARCAAHLARPARGRRGAPAIRAHARGPRLPAARLHGRCGCRLAARLLPVLRGPARQAHRLLAVRRGRRPGQAGAVRAGPPALRRRPQARRALQPSRCAPAFPRW